MESEYRKGYVYIQSHFAGIIAETEEGYTFVYDKDYLNREDAVAVSLEAKGISLDRIRKYGLHLKGKKC
ncbi:MULTISPECIES: HipA N-terminal domain-containing protein [unclassified Blautia]|uniref:HipA N-terminal domain-containing protein n=1 Tax=unclassified Blautia TaxID=2648079 RepID=UPI003F8AC84E